MLQIFQNTEQVVTLPNFLQGQHDFDTNRKSMTEKKTIDLYPL